MRGLKSRHSLYKQSIFPAAGAGSVLTVYTPAAFKHAY